MGHDELRHDTECQNCGYTVDVAYCSKCGQKNTETRQSFHHLITHFAEDLTHYDGAFWKTIKYLLFRPGKLTIEYLEGHRMRYVPPVKLYIFISFITFFLMAIMAPAPEAEEHNNTHTTVIAEPKIKKVMIEGIPMYSVKQLDSLNDSRSPEQKLGKVQYYIYKSVLKANEGKFTARDIIVTAAHTIPKVLFIYMPIFAFWLWIFHGKKRWYFFDHGIFTLHYFSFLLLTATIIMVLSWALDYLSEDIAIAFASLAYLSTLLYYFFYFFRAHRKIYGESRTISRLKGFALFIINMILILFGLLFTMLYIFLNIH